jgi:acetyltransferase-like isoleucine patch superfamily enzyme
MWLLASALRRWWAVFRNPQATIAFGPGVRLGRGFSLHVPGGGTFEVGRDVVIGPGYRTELGGPGARISIGDRSRIGHDVIITCDTTIELGEGVDLGADAYITDGSHRYRDLSKTFLEQGYDYQHVVIGDGARIERGCTLVHCVGAGAVIGPNSMVSKEIPPGAYAVGVPAKAQSLPPTAD